MIGVQGTDWELVNSWILRYCGVSTELARLLDMKFVMGSSSLDTPVGITVKDVLQTNNDQNFVEREIQLQRLEYLCQHLRIIEKTRSPLLRKIRKKLRTQDWAAFHGARMEAYVAASLTKKNLLFVCPDPPDFRIEHREKSIFIECTSSHPENTAADGTEKIKKVVLSKAGKPYANDLSALFIDATGAFYNNIVNGKDVVKDQLSIELNHTIQQSRFGSVVLFQYIASGTDERFALRIPYIRIDSEVCNMVLKNFLDRHFPFGSYEPDCSLFPSSG